MLVGGLQLPFAGARLTGIGSKITITITLSTREQCSLRDRDCDLERHRRRRSLFSTKSR